MQGEDEDVDSGWDDEANGEETSSPSPAASSRGPRKNTPVGGLLAPVRRDDERNKTPAFGMLAPSGDPRGNKTPALGMLAAPPPEADSTKKTPAFGTLLPGVSPPPPPQEPSARAGAAPGAGTLPGAKKTPVGGLQAPPRPFPDLEPAPLTAKAPAVPGMTPDRATMPPPMPEAEYIEHVLAMDEGEPVAQPRKRLNTLVETDPLQYDQEAEAAAAARDEFSRPTRPPVTASGPPQESFLDLDLDLADPGAEQQLDDRVRGARSFTPPTVRSDDLDDLPVDDVIDSIPARAYSVRPPQAAAPTGKPAAEPAPSSSSKRAPTTLKNPGARYDSSPSIEVEQPEDDELGLPPAPSPAPRAAAARSPAIPPPSPAPRDLQVTPPAAASHVAPKQPAASRGMPQRGRGSGRPPAATPAAGTPVISPAARRTPLPRASSEPPTREIFAPPTASRPKPPARALDKVVERFEAGDFGRALMLAEQAFDDARGTDAEDLRHYAELCREKLRQTYLDRIGSGRTILRVTVDPDTLRGRSLDPRLAFLLSLLDGASSVDDVIDMSTMPALEAVRALHELMQEGVVEVVEPGRRRKAP